MVSFTKHFVFTKCPFLIILKINRNILTNISLCMNLFIHLSSLIYEFIYENFISLYTLLSIQTQRGWIPFSVVMEPTRKKCLPSVNETDLLPHSKRQMIALPWPLCESPWTRAKRNKFGLYPNWSNLVKWRNKMYEDFAPRLLGSSCLVFGFLNFYSMPSLEVQCFSFFNSNFSGRYFLLMVFICLRESEAIRENSEEKKWKWKNHFYCESASLWFLKNNSKEN